MPACWFRVLVLLPGGWLPGWRWLPVVLLGLLPAAARAQLPGAKPAFQFQRPTQRKVRVPFNFQRNLIIIEVFLNGQGPYNFLLDSGVGISLITDPTLIKPLGLRRGANYTVAGAGQEKPLEAF